MKKQKSINARPKLKSKSGITLIALVITIIVLLILAGVSISMVIGNNGVLKQASTSVVETKEGEETEQVELAYVSAKAVKLGGNVTAKDIGDELKLNGVDATANGENPIIVEFTKTRNRYQIKDGKAVKSEGTTTGETLASKVTPANYGDKVEYTANGISDWRIFYNDSDNVFLITTDYLPASKIPTTIGLVRTNEYMTSWTSFSEVLIDSSVANKYRMSLGIIKEQVHFFSVARLLDTTQWESFKDTTGFAYSAIGSPTLEMWIDSWNEKYNDTLVYYETEDGYAIAENSTATENYYIDASIMAEKDGYKVEEANNMYYPHKDVISDNGGECERYWLASPSCSHVVGVNIVQYDGRIGSADASTGTGALRPVVCLNSEVLGTKVGDKWVLGE